MITAEEALSLAGLENHPVKVWKACDTALNKAVIEAIEAWKNKVKISLWFKDCPEDDETVAAYLKQFDYENIKVTHDYPRIWDDYKWTTLIKFNF